MADAQDKPQQEAPDSVVLEEEIDPNYAPSESEVVEYAKWLGMDLEKDVDLFWIAREGLMAPLPKDWKPCRTKDTDDIYYFNFSSGESTWDHPCDGYYKRLYEEEKKKKEIGLKESSDQNRSKAKQDVEQLLGKQEKKKKKKKGIDGSLQGPGPVKALPGISDRKNPLPGIRLSGSSLSSLNSSTQSQIDTNTNTQQSPREDKQAKSTSPAELPIAGSSLSAAAKSKASLKLLSAVNVGSNSADEGDRKQDSHDTSAEVKQGESSTRSSSGNSALQPSILEPKQSDSSPLRTSGSASHHNRPDSRLDSSADSGLDSRADSKQSSPRNSGADWTNPKVSSSGSGSNDIGDKFEGNGLRDSGGSTSNSTSTSRATSFTGAMPLAPIRGTLGNNSNNNNNNSSSSGRSNSSTPPLGSASGVVGGGSSSSEPRSASSTSAATAGIASMTVTAAADEKLTSQQQELESAAKPTSNTQAGTSGAGSGSQHNPDVREDVVPAAEYKKLEAQLQESRNKCAVQERLLLDSEQQLSALRSSSATLRSQLEMFEQRYSSSNDEWKEKLRKLEGEKEQLDVQRRELKLQVLDLEMKASAVSRPVVVPPSRASTAEMDTEGKTSQELQDKIVTLEEEVKEAKAALSAATAVNEELQLRISLTEQSRQRRDIAVATESQQEPATADSCSLSAQVLQLQQALQAAESNRAATEASQSNLQDLQQSMQRRVDLLKDDKEALQVDLERCASKVSSANEEAERCKAAAASIQEEAQKLTTKLATAQSELDAVTAASAAEKASLNKQIAELNTQLGEVNKQLLVACNNTAAETTASKSVDGDSAAKLVAATLLADEVEKSTALREAKHTLESDCALLKEKVRLFEAEKSSLIGQLSRQGAELSHAKSELNSSAAIQERNRVLAAENLILSERVSALEGKLQSHVAAESDLRHSYESLLTEKQSADNRFQAMSDTVNTLQRERDEGAAASTQKDKKIRSYQEELLQLQRRLSDANAANAAASNISTALANSSEESSSELERLKQQLKDANVECQSLRAAKLNLENALAVSDAQVERQRSDVATLQAQIAVLTRGSESRQDEASATASKAYAEVCATLQQVEAERSALRGELLSAQREVNSISAECEVRTQASNRFEEESSSYKEKWMAAEARLVDLQIHVSQLQDEGFSMDAVKRSLAAAEASAAKDRIELVQWKEKEKLAQSQNMELRSELELKRTRNDVLEADIKRLQAANQQQPSLPRPRVQDEHQLPLVPESAAATGVTERDQLHATAPKAPLRNSADTAPMLFGANAQQIVELSMVVGRQQESMTRLQAQLQAAEAKIGQMQSSSNPVSVPYSNNDLREQRHTHPSGDTSHAIQFLFGSAEVKAASGRSEAERGVPAAAAEVVANEFSPQSNEGSVSKAALLYSDCSSPAEPTAAQFTRANTAGKVGKQLQHVGGKKGFAALDWNKGRSKGRKRADEEDQQTSDTAFLTQQAPLNKQIVKLIEKSELAKSVKERDSYPEHPLALLALAQKTTAEVKTRLRKEQKLLRELQSLFNATKKNIKHDQSCIKNLKSLWKNSRGQYGKSVLSAGEINGVTVVVNCEVDALRAAQNLLRDRDRKLRCAEQLLVHLERLTSPSQNQSAAADTHGEANSTNNVATAATEVQLQSALNEVRSTQQQLAADLQSVLAAAAAQLRRDRAQHLSSAIDTEDLHMPVATSLNKQAFAVFEDYRQEQQFGGFGASASAGAASIPHDQRQLGAPQQFRSSADHSITTTVAAAGSRQQHHNIHNSQDLRHIHNPDFKNQVLREQISKFSERQIQSKEVCDSHAGWLDALSKEIGKASHAMPATAPTAARAGTAGTVVTKEAADNAFDFSTTSSLKNAQDKLLKHLYNFNL